MESRDQAANKAIEKAWNLANNALTPGKNLNKGEKEQWGIAREVLKLESDREKAITERNVAMMDCFLKAVASGYLPDSIKDTFTNPFDLLESLKSKQDEMQRELLPPYRQYQRSERLNQDFKDSHEDALKR